MSRHAPTSDLPLFSPPNPEAEEVERIHEDMEDRNRRWLSRARRELARLYEWAGRPLSTDDLWKMMETGDVPALPPDASSNLLGSVFSGSDEWEPVGFIRSSREGSHGNLLRTWRLVA